MSLARILAAALMLLGSPTAAQTVPYEASNAPLPDTDTPLDQMELQEDAVSRLTAAVHVSGTGPFRFLVDTGSNKTVISRDLAARLGLPSGKPVRMHSMTGQSVVPTALVASIVLGGQQLSISNAPLLDPRNMGADGILGLDSLRSQRLVFDFRAPSLAIVPATQPTLVEEKDTIVVRAKRRAGRLIVTNAQADNVPLQLVVDTGAELSVGNEALRRALLRGRNLLDPAGRAALYSVDGGRLVGDQMVLAELEFGGVTLQNLTIVFADAHTSRQLRLNRKPALLLGMNGMRAFDTVSIDFAKKRLRLKVSEIDGARTADRRNQRRTD